MVLLTMTPAMANGLKRLKTSTAPATGSDSEASTSEVSVTEGEADLSAPDVAKPISHEHVLQLWKDLKALPDTESQNSAPTLEALLIGASVYVPPPPPKPEPSAEYKVLMARLRRDEEARAYERMVNPPEPFYAATSQFAQIHRPVRAADTGDDDGVTLSDVNRQVMVIFNFVLTMAGVAFALWQLARWWPTPSRLFLAMGGCVAAGIAEYGLYAGYMWHLSEAAKKDKRPAKEVREVAKTWKVGASSGVETDDDEEAVPTGANDDGREGSEDTAGIDEKRATPAGEAALSIPGSTTASGIDGGTARRRRQEGASS